IGTAAINEDLYLKQAEVHGMSQRGGDVQSNLRLSDSPIASDLIPEGRADVIVSVEPMECLRYLPMLATDGWIITNTVPFENISNYPEMEKVMDKIKTRKNHIVLDAESIAKDLGTVKAANMVVLGAAAPFLGLPYKALEDAIRAIFGRKGEEVVNLNLNALKAGKDLAMAQK
ncbi:MAG TPA: indolepyruvate oxidoreductase subunit beta, partial [Bacteroidales bacterium]|nr:indolepyruvate oxidoreductase subunit beta [Bacteroidales bacterium]